MKLKPLGDRVLVRRVEETDQKSAGGIIIPDTAKEKPQQGTVEAVGQGMMKDDGQRVPPSVQAGDKVLFGKYSGSEVKLDGEEFLIMHESDILGILSD